MPITLRGLVSALCVTALIGALCGWFAPVPVNAAGVGTPVNKRLIVVTRDFHGSGYLGRGEREFAGNFRPGNSPGCVEGEDLNFRDTSVVIIEIGGPTPCADHDRLIVENQLNLNGATLQLVLLNGYQPASGTSFDILDWAVLNGTFGSVDTSAALLPAGNSWDFSGLHDNGVIGVVVDSDPAENVAVPLPWPAVAILGGALACLARRRLS